MKPAVVFIAYYFSCLLNNCSTGAQPQVEDFPQADAEDAQCISVSGQVEECDASSFARTCKFDDGDNDPMLRKMPEYDFYAYLRADVSTFHGEEPGSRKEQTPKEQSRACKFINMSPDPVSLVWDGPTGPGAIRHVAAWAAAGIPSYPPHVFAFTKLNRPDQILCRFNLVSGTSVYFCNPYVPNNKEDPSHGKYMSSPLSLDTLSPSDRKHYNDHVNSLTFSRAYKNFTETDWFMMYPHSKPRHKMWRADRIGQEHVVTTKETHFVEIPPKPKLQPNLSIHEMKKTREDLLQYRLMADKGEVMSTMNMTLKALSCAPRVFEIPNFLSDVEARYILNVVEQNGSLQRSTQNGQATSGRTSRTTWVPRDTDPILNAIYRRAADALRLDEALLRHRQEDELEQYEYLGSKFLDPINEHLQIVHYAVGQEFQVHHDFRYALPGQVDSPSRSINLAMYLNDVPKGGETSFPLWRNGETSEALKVKPEKGKAIIFYMRNPDGNLDQLTLHAGLPVLEGEKWFSNLWIHDPIRAKK